MVRIAFALVVFLLWSTIAHAEKRIALVFGNSAYQNASKLLNPGNDAKAIAEMLRAAGFEEVALHENLGIKKLRQAIKDFSDLARDADAAVIYYSGHGIEVNGVNYLIPTDAVLDRDIDTPYEAYSLDNLLQAIEPARRLRLVMLDACRDNPFTRSMKRTIGSRAIGRGLAAVEPTTVNTLIGFAAKAGSIALDGEGANSPYATAVLNNLVTPGLDVRIAFGRVRDEVLKITGNKQEPFVYGSLGGAEIALVPGNFQRQTDPPRLVTDYAKTKEMEVAFWNTVKDSKSKHLLQAYLERYPSGNFVRLAKVLIEQLNREGTASTVVASLPSGAQVPATTNRANKAAEEAKLVRALQTELKRIGCDPGAIDGNWGPKAKDALAEFERYAKIDLKSDAPTEDALRQLSTHKATVCPPARPIDEAEQQKEKKRSHGVPKERERVRTGHYGFKCEGSNPNIKCRRQKCGYVISAQQSASYVCD